MRYDKLPQAERLFDAMGLIDDVILTETQTPNAARLRTTRRTRLRALIAMASAFAIITVGVFGGALSSILNEKNNDGAEAPEMSAPSNAADGLEAFLDDAAKSGKGTPVDPDSLDFFDGTTRIIWRSEGDDTYYMLSVASSLQTNRIQAQLKQESAALTPDQAETVGCSVWIAYGDGTVVSPYLKNSAGNVGYARLFDYAPEIEPGTELTELLRDSVTD